MRVKLLLLGFVLFVVTLSYSIYKNDYYIIPLIFAFLFVVALYNITQKSHAILRNFPVLGYFRYGFESIAPEIQQYFIERNTDGTPFSRTQRSLVYERAKNLSATVPFGTQLEINHRNYSGLKHSIFPAHVREDMPRIQIGGSACTKPYMASIYNISAMSFGSLSENAVRAMNAGAQRGGFYHNTGEGGLSEFHLQGADVCWQIGTGYFGCRTPEGDFDAQEFAKKTANSLVKLIELKLSQGAKPGHGGVLPASKNTPYVAKIRGVDPHTTVLSPPGHTAFSNPEGLVRFVQHMRELAQGKPIGFKLCIGETKEFEAICEAMIALDIYPDFITVDGAEGGTGAAPLEFSDSVGMPLEPALIFVNKTLKNYGIRDKLRVIASGKIISGISILRNIALGADLCNSARGFMFAVGCIQALRCNDNKCPTGVATQDARLMKGLVVEDKAERVFHFHKNTVLAANELLAAAGKSSYAEVDINIFMRGDEFQHLEDLYYPDNLENVTKN